MSRATDTPQPGRLETQGGGTALRRPDLGPVTLPLHPGPQSRDSVVWSHCRDEDVFPQSGRVP